MIQAIHGKPPRPVSTKKSDVLLEITPVREVDDVHEALDGREVGDDVVLTVVRGPNTSRPETLKLSVLLKSE